MIKKGMNTLISLFIVFGMLASATPAFADSRGTELKGSIAAVDIVASTVTVTPSRGGANVTLVVNASTYLRRLGRTATIADLQVGDLVEAKYTPGTLVASKIEAKLNLVELKGSIAAVDTAANTVTVTSSRGGASVTLVVTASTYIKRLGRAATIVDLQVGDLVEAKYSPVTLQASSIEAELNLVELKGSVVAVDAVAGSLTVTPYRGGASVTLTVNASTYITRRGVSVTLASLLVGDRVEAKYLAGTMLASKVEVK